VTENWLSAARAFGAIEAYAGRPKPWYIVRTIQDTYWITSLGPTQVSGRTVWFLGDSSFTYVDCPNGPITPVPDVDVEAMECPNANGTGRLSTVSDRSGTVESCVSLGATPEEMMAAVSSPTVVNPDGDPLKLRLSGWASCARSLDITMVRVASGRWEVEAIDPGSLLLCAGLVTIELSLARPIPADQVDLTLIKR
jgi:hypothetical protein